MNKKELYKYEKPILIFPVKVQKLGCFTFPVNFVDALGIDENHIVLFRLKDFHGYEAFSKLCKNRKGRKSYTLRVPQEVVERLKIELPQLVMVEIISILKKCYKPEINEKKNYIDIVPYFSEDKRFTLFDRGFGYITVHYLEHSCPSIITIKRYLNLDEFFCWNLGFYLADGTKHKRDHRFSAANAKEYLMNRFRDFGEKYFGINRDEWYLDIATNKYNKKKIKFWKENLDINEKRIKLKVLNIRPPKTPYGNASLSIYNKVLGFIIKKIIFDMEFIKSLSYQNAFAFLRGIEAGDGGVCHFKTGTLELNIISLKEDIRIINYLLSFVCSKPPRIREHYTSDKVLMLYYRGTDMAREFLLNGHFKEHHSRWNKLLNIYKERVKREFKYLDALINNCETVREIETYTGISYRACNLMIKKFIDLGFVDYKIKKVNNYNLDMARVFIITNMGREYISLLGLKA